MTLSAVIVVADSLLRVENLFPARIGKFNPRLIPTTSMRVVNFKQDVIPGIIYCRSVNIHKLVRNVYFLRYSARLVLYFATFVTIMECCCCPTIVMTYGKRARITVFFVMTAFFVFSCEVFIFVRCSSDQLLRLSSQQHMKKKKVSRDTSRR